MAFYSGLSRAIAALRSAILGQASVIAAFPVIQIGGGERPFLPQIDVLAADMTKLQAALNDFRVPFEMSLHQVIIPAIEQNFNAEGRPHWAPLSPATVRIRGAAHPILNRTGQLKRIATSTGIWNIGRTEMSAGSSFSGASYGIFHQSGTRKMPARPFLTITDEDANQIAAVFNEWLGTEVSVIGGFH